MVLLNGKLEIIVIEARGLPNLDHSFTNPNDKSDPYCVVECVGANGSQRIGKTHTIDDCLDPKWLYKITTRVNQDVKGLKFTVKDKDLVGSETIGFCYLDVTDFTGSGRKYVGDMALTSSKKKKSAGSIKVQVSFTSSEGGMETTAVLEQFQVHKESLKDRMRVSTTKKSTTPGGPNSYFFHGVLEIFVDKAKHLPNLDSSIFSLKKNDVSDPYVAIFVIDDNKDTWRIATTSVIDNNLNPVWEERFFINLCHNVRSIKFEVRDKDVVSSDEVGSIVFMAEDVMNPQGIKGGFDLYIARKIIKKSKLFLEMKFSSTHEMPDHPEVIGCPYPLREGNWVTLYQDAHCVGLPMQIFSGSGQVYQPRRAWEDLYNVIINAKEYIFIVGWSVNARVRMLRWQNEDNRCIGDILLQKADEGVQVCLLVWDELTSTELNKEGAMATSDEATEAFFRGTKVTVILVPRERKSKDFSTKEKFTNFCYSHHQKCVIIDSETKNSPKREPIAFVGGLDITDGRFDTPEHPLFRTLDNDHKGDFYNKIFLTHPSYGPRLPWHDIHCCIQGPAAQDLLSNFKERWEKQGSVKRRSDSLKGDTKVRKSVMPNFPDSWNVQMFRSINSDSAVFSKSSRSLGLSIKKGRVYDSSIQRAYIQNIRRSKKFMYIENQYFLGSSHEWLECRDTRISNLIPLEIVLHIEDKIRSGFRYVAYVLIPMFPEGKPADKVTQEILHWQYRTMEMMYKRIANTIEEVGVDATPQDYLLFFCLGRKEGLNQAKPPEELTGHALKAFTHMRNMIYVHSKMAIFDDEYIIVGSANINDRSLSGNRDTEIAIGAYQPQHRVQTGRLPNGEVALFRKALWAEHIGEAAPLGQDPSSITCARMVKSLADEGLLTYIDKGRKKGARHLLLYPLKVAQDGSISQREECPKFPDTDASIIGKRSGYIPTRLTS